MVCWVFGEIGYRKLGSFNAILISLGLIVVFLVGLELLAPIPIIHASIIHYQIRKGGEKSLCCAEQ